MAGSVKWKRVVGVVRWRGWLVVWVLLVCCVGGTEGAGLLEGCCDIAIAINSVLKTIHGKIFDQNF